MLIELCVVGTGAYLGSKVFKKRQRKLGAILAEEHRAALQGPTPLPSWYDKTKQSLQLFISQQLVAKLDKLQALKTNPEQSEEVRFINRRLALAGGVFVLASVGMLGYPILLLICVPPFLVYETIPILQEGYRELKERRKIGGQVLNALAMCALLGLGYFWIAALGNLIFWSMDKLRLRVYNTSRRQLTSAFGEQPRTVWLQHGEVEMEVPYDKVQPGDIVVVHAGEVIPVDGIITNGIASIDQHMLTGESQPAEKGVGESVFTATIVLSGTIYVQVEKAGAETIVANIGHILEQTSDYTSSLELRGKVIADKTILPVLGTCLVTLGILGPTAALCTLFCYPGEGMRLLGPLSLMNFISLAAKRGILVKDGRAMETLGEVDTVVFDKTGTLTQEQPHVVAIHLCGHYTETELLRYAASAETRQTHPLARAILEEAEARQLDLLTLDDASYEIGYGLTVHVESKCIRVGSARFMDKEGLALPHPLEAIQAEIHDRGYVLVYVAIDEAIEGAIELHPTIRPEAKQIVEGLHQRGLQVAIISGDHEQPTQQLAHDLGIDRYFAETLPEPKARIVEQLQGEGKTVCFVGDGINDAIALKQSHVSVSLSGASMIASDTANIIFMDGTLNPMLPLLELADDLKTNMERNLLLLLSPAPLLLGGVYFLHFRLLATTILLTTGSLSGITNAMLPALKNREEAST